MAAHNCFSYRILNHNVVAHRDWRASTKASGPGSRGESRARDRAANGALLQVVQLAHTRS